MQELGDTLRLASAAARSLHWYLHAGVQVMLQYAQQQDWGGWLRSGVHDSNKIFGVVGDADMHDSKVEHNRITVIPCLSLQLHSAHIAYFTKVQQATQRGSIPL